MNPYSKLGPVASPASDDGDDNEMPAFDGIVREYRSPSTSPVGSPSSPRRQGPGGEDDQGAVSE
jgi:hypothetical protein